MRRGPERGLHDVADGVDARHGGAVEGVYRHLVALDGDAQFFETDALDVGFDAHGRQYDVGRQRLGALLAFDLHLATRIGRAYALHGRRGEHRGAQFAEGAFHRFRDFLVFERQHAGHVLYDGDFHP